MAETRRYLEGGSPLETVTFACFGAEARDMYRAAIDDTVAGR